MDEPDGEDAPPLFDDPRFLAELAELDRGLTSPPRTQATRPPAAIPPDRAARRRRALIDLFPPVAPDASRASPPASEAAAHGPAPDRSIAPPPRGQPAEPHAEPATADDRSTPYLAFYGFSERPFALEPDPRFVYRTPSHDRAAHAVTDVVRADEGVAVVLGDMGLGKTLLCRVLAQQLDGRRLVSVVTAIASPAELVRRLLVDFGVASPDDVVQHASAASARETLRSFLLSLSRIPAVAVVIIDDAHRLSTDVLEELQTLLTGDAIRRVLRLVLVGEPELLAVLNQHGLSGIEQQVAGRARLDSLDAAEIAGYIAHRMATAGRPRIDFDEDALRAVSHFSAGIPALVNAICDRALTVGSQRASSAIDAGCVTRAAEDVGLVPIAAAQRYVVPAGAAVVLLSLLVVGGSIGSAYVFRDRVRNGVMTWQAVPQAPAAPVLRQTAPLGPVPIPPDR